MEGALEKRAAEDIRCGRELNYDSFAFPDSLLSCHQ
jgi:hypothetical protein